MEIAPWRALTQYRAMLDHISIQCQDPTVSTAFYDAVLATLGGERLIELGPVVGYGVPPRPVFWVGPQQHGGGVPGEPHRLPGGQS